MEIRGANGLVHAMRLYRRLCADPESAVYNRASGAELIREGLASTPRANELMTILQEVPFPVSTVYLRRAMGEALTQGNLGMQLFRLTEYGLLERTWDNPPGRRGGRWLYQLSALGRLVMQEDNGVPHGH